jgi:hypothetical protein
MEPAHITALHQNPIIARNGTCYAPKNVPAFNERVACQT